MNPGLAMAVAFVMVLVIAAVTFGLAEYIVTSRKLAADKCGTDCPWCLPPAYHAPDCDGSSCDECGFIAADGLWYPGPCPVADGPHQLARAEGGV